MLVQDQEQEKKDVVRSCACTESYFHSIHLTRLVLCVFFRVPPVFVLHFVDGLPNSDVRMYNFTFKGNRYSVTTVIQYDQQLKHFVSWVSNSDGR